MRHARLLLALAVLLAASAATATEPKAAVLAIEAAPLFGPATPVVDGWFSVAVRLANQTEAQVEGDVELVSELRWVSESTRTTTRAPFAVPGKGEVTLQLPTHGWVDSGADLTVRAVSGDGRVLAEVELPTALSPAPLLFDLASPSRIASFVRGAGLAVSRQPSSRSYGPPSLAVGTAGVAAKTGDLVLPDRAAGYAGATVVLARSEQITSLTGRRLEAIVNWVLGGGSLAMVVSRPEDLRHPTVRAMVGGRVEKTSAPAELHQETTFLVVPKSSGSHSWGGTIPARRVRRAPSKETSAALVGYRGGNLHESRWGAAASYGLGEVHLLAFDATRTPAVDDRWVQLEMVDLVRHSWERRAHVVLPHAALPLDSPRVDEVRKVLDPNEGTRWTVAVSAIVLLVYSVLAGPVSFLRAARRLRPLRALLHLPIWSGATMAVIVLLGVAAKGVTGRSRHLSLIECGAGMTRGAITRFRGFYASSADRITVQAGHPSNVLDVAGESDDTARRVIVDRDGSRIEGLHAKPWQTVVVREDGFAELGGAVSIVERGTNVVVKNRLGRDLVSVVVKTPGQPATYFARIADGEAVDASKGRKLPSAIGARTASGDPTPLGLERFAEILEGGSRDATVGWRALERLSFGTVDWWPEGVPTLLGQIAGGEGRRSDSGLALEQDHLLIRVVGFGGVP